MTSREDFNWTDEAKNLKEGLPTNNKRKPHEYKEQVLNTPVPKFCSDFKLIGLSSPRSCTLTPLNNETIFWANISMNFEEDKVAALWNYCKGNWADRKIAEVEHEGLREDGTPVNPIVLNIREWDLEPYDIRYPSGD